MEKGTPVIAIVSQESVNLNNHSNIKEVKARGANTVIISLHLLSSETDQIVIDDVHSLLTVCSNAANFLLRGTSTWI